MTGISGGQVKMADKITKVKVENKTEQELTLVMSFDSTGHVRDHRSLPQDMQPPAHYHMNGECSLVKAGYKPRCPSR